VGCLLLVLKGCYLLNPSINLELEASELGNAKLPIAVTTSKELNLCRFLIRRGYQSAVDIKLPKVTLGDICHVVDCRQGLRLVLSPADTNGGSTRAASNTLGIERSLQVMLHLGTDLGRRTSKRNH
jgi:hypothetical protein